MDLDGRNEKLKRILLLLAKGTALMTVIAAPKTSRLFKGFLDDNTEWKEWKLFNSTYLKRTIRKLEKQELVEIIEEGDKATVKITKKGMRKVLKFGLDSITISKPSRWDGKWRLVFYDVLGGKRSVRDKFRSYLKSAGFYQFQESVYLHAYPCEKEIDFLKYYLGIGSEVRYIIAEKIENDQEFRDYFGV